MESHASVVLKFGGTSVQDAEAIGRLVRVVADERRHRAVVVSALAGVTDALSELAAGALDGPAASALARHVLSRHVDLVGEVVAPDRQDAVGRCVTALLSVVAPRAGDRPVAASPADRDALLAAGELASSVIVAEALACAGVRAAWVDAREVIMTDAAFGSARPDEAAIHEAAGRLLVPLVGRGIVPVLGGFVGGGPGGVTTTLGRGGSDYSAALVAAALVADELQIWTDVDGVFTADPRVVARARRIPRLSFDAAYEMARFGAKVLHWGTLDPAARHDIPVRVLDSRRPDSEGTVIASRVPGAGPAVAGLAHQGGVTVAHLRARGVAGSRRFLETALAWIDREGRRATVVSLSENRAIVSSPDRQLIDRLVDASAGVADAQVSHGAALVAVVGDNIAAHPGVWQALGAEVDAGRLALVSPSQSGHALVSFTSPDVMAAVIGRLHDRLVGVPADADLQAAGGRS